MQRVYDLFRRRVADGRGLSVERVHELGRGHVYSGVDAKDLGLVDHLGGLHDAIAHVRAEAKVSRIQPVTIRVLPRKRRLLDLILDATEPVGGALVRRGARSKEAPAVPLALSRAVARLPLSILFLPQDRASVLTPGVITFD